MSKRSVTNKRRLGSVGAALAGILLAVGPATAKTAKVTAGGSHGQYPERQAGPDWALGHDGFYRIATVSVSPLPLYVPSPVYYAPAAKSGYVAPVQPSLNVLIPAP